MRCFAASLIHVDNIEATAQPVGIYRYALLSFGCLMVNGAYHLAYAVYDADCNLTCLCGIKFSIGEAVNRVGRNDKVSVFALHVTYTCCLAHALLRAVVRSIAEFTPSGHP